MTRRQTLSRRTFLQAAGASLFLAACVAPMPAAEPGTTGGESPSAEPVVLRMHMRAGGETSEPGIYVQRPAEFTEETGIQVQLEPIPANEYYAKIETLAASNTLGDNMYTLFAGWGHHRLVHFGLIQTVDEFMEAEGISHDEWKPGVIGGCIIDGKTYGLPKSGHPNHAYVWINHALFEEAGIPIPETYNDATWEQYREWANALAKGEPDRREVYGIHMPTENGRMFTNGVRTFGGWELNEEGTESPTTDDGWRGFITAAYNFYQVDKTMPKAADLGSEGAIGLFAAGKLGMMVASRGANGQIREVVGPEDGSGGSFAWSALALAEGPNFNGWGAALDTHAGTTQSQHKYESFLLTYALSDARFAWITAREEGYLVGRTNELEEIGDVAEDVFIQLQFNQYAKSVPQRYGVNYRGTEWDQIIRNQTELVYLGEREPDDAFFEELGDLIRDLLARPI